MSGGKDSGYMEKRDSELSQLTEYLDSNSASKLLKDQSKKPTEEPQLSEGLYETVPNVAYVTQKSVTDNNQYAGHNFASAPVIPIELPTKADSRESSKPNESDSDDRKSRISHSSDSVFQFTGRSNGSLQP